MMVTILIMSAVGALALALAWLAQRQRRPSPTSTTGEPPAQLDRTDFRSPDTRWLIAVFTSASCASCERVWNELASYESATTVAQNIEVAADPDLHRKYRIDSVPTAVITGADGIVRHAVVGPLAPDDRRDIGAILADDG